MASYAFGVYCLIMVLFWCVFGICVLLDVLSVLGDLLVLVCWGFGLL